MMELYLDLLSQPCRSVFLFAKLAGIPFEFKHVDLTAGKSGLLIAEEGRVGDAAPASADLSIKFVSLLFAGF